jgi:hypothetical protein
LEDVEIVRRLGRRRMTILKSGALTSSERYRKDGYLRRIFRNQVCLLMYACGIPQERIANYYKAPSGNKQTTSEGGTTTSKELVQPIKPS